MIKLIIAFLLGFFVFYGWMRYLDETRCEREGLATVVDYKNMETYCINLEYFEE